MMTQLVVLISGRGSNLKALIDAIDANELNANIAAVISNRSDAKGLELAQQRDIPTQVITAESNNREQFDEHLAQSIQRYSPDWIILAGFMRILGSQFVDRFAGRILNIHPSLLPKYPGLNTHERALAAGDKVHGASVHIVTAELDGGPVIGQVTVPVLEDDNVESLSQRVLQAEHKLYVAILGYCINENLSIENNRCYTNASEVTLPILNINLSTGKLAC